MALRDALCVATAVAVVTCASLYASETIPSIRWEDISDRDISPDGRLALSLRPDDWRHAETDHFVYHYIDEKTAYTVYLYAEIYYDWMKNLFGIAEDRWRKKGHIFVLAEGPLWDEFMARSHRAGKYWGGFCSGWELFMARPAHWVSARKTLAHELCHLIVFRFMEGPLPSFLNEGFAQFAERQMVGQQVYASDREYWPLPVLEEEAYIPLAQLQAAAHPPDEQEAMRVFYDESELLVMFVSDRYSNQKLYEIMRAVSGGKDFAAAVGEILREDPVAFEDAFKRYAVRR